MTLTLSQAIQSLKTGTPWMRLTAQHLELLGKSRTPLQLGGTDTLLTITTPTRFLEVDLCTGTYRDVPLREARQPLPPPDSVSPSPLAVPPDAAAGPLPALPAALAHIGAIDFGAPSSPPAEAGIPLPPTPSPATAPASAPILDRGGAPPDTSSPGPSPQVGSPAANASTIPAPAPCCAVVPQTPPPPPLTPTVVPALTGVPPLSPSSAVPLSPAAPCLPNPVADPAAVHPLPPVLQGTSPSSIPVAVPTSPSAQPPGRPSTDVPVELRQRLYQARSAVYRYLAAAGQPAFALGNSAEQVAQYGYAVALLEAGHWSLLGQWTAGSPPDPALLDAARVHGFGLPAVPSLGKGRFLRSTAGRLIAAMIVTDATGGITPVVYEREAGAWQPHPIGASTAGGSLSDARFEGIHDTPWTKYHILSMLVSGALIRFTRSASLRLAADAAARQMWRELGQDGARYPSRRAA